MEDRYEWDLRLQDMLEQAVKNAYQGAWEYSYHSNQGMACDIFDIEGKFEVERFEHDVEEEELRVYARIGKNITELYEAQSVIYEVLGIASEDFLVLVPLHTPESFQFWCIIGTQSHGHKVRIILKREDNPHIHPGRW